MHFVNSNYLVIFIPFGRKQRGIIRFILEIREYHYFDLRYQISKFQTSNQQSTSGCTNDFYVIKYILYINIYKYFYMMNISSKQDMPSFVKE